jgi:hypothetical protein
MGNPNSVAETVIMRHNKRGLRIMEKFKQVKGEGGVETFTECPKCHSWDVISMTKKNRKKSYRCKECNHKEN